MTSNSTKTHLCILNINFQSVIPKKTQLKNLIEQQNPDIIIGSETWLQPEDSNDFIDTNQFNVYRKDKNPVQG